jgi:hypothetical protein
MMASADMKALALRRTGLLARLAPGTTEAQQDDCVTEEITEEERVSTLCSYLAVVRAVAAQIELITRVTEAPGLDDALLELTVHRVRGLLEGAVTLARATASAAHVDPYGTRTPGIVQNWHGEVPRRGT